MALKSLNSDKILTFINPDKHHPEAQYVTEATEAIASMPPGQCLGALEMLQ